MRIFQPYPHVFAFYDGRPETPVLDQKSWVDDGALALGIASYAVIAGKQAIVYDTHTTLEHARAVRAALESAGVKRIRVVLSHWHLDHIAGNEVFSDCEIIAHRLTDEAMHEHKAGIEDGTFHGPPAINPLVMPSIIFDGRLDIELGEHRVELHRFDIHSTDGVVLYLPGDRLLLAGDTLEDTVTYVSEAEGIETHIAELERMSKMPIDRILPNHGDAGLIATGGYEKTLIRAQQQYLRALLRMPDDEALREKPLKEIIAGPLMTGWVTWFDGYERVHKQNIERVMKRKS